MASPPPRSRTLALGIGANTAVFSVVRGRAVEPLPFRDPNRLVGIVERQPEVPWAPGAAADIVGLADAEPNFRRHRLLRLRVVERSAAAEIRSGSSAPACRRSSSGCSASGRSSAVFFRRSRRSRRREVVLGHAFWKRQFSGGREALGQTLHVEGEDYTVVGVMPRRFDLPEESDFWIPLSLTAAQRADRGNHNYQVLGRSSRASPSPPQRPTCTRIETALQRLPRGNSGTRRASVPLDRQLSDVGAPRHC